MRTIKFRAKTFNDEIVFGDLIHLNFKYLPAVHLFIVDFNGEHEVVPDSVAQLVGFDRNKQEVYERDELANPNDGSIFKAALNHIYTVKAYDLFRSNP